MEDDIWVSDICPDCKVKLFRFRARFICPHCNSIFIWDSTGELVCNRKGIYYHGQLVPLISTDIEPLVIMALKRDYSWDDHQMMKCVDKEKALKTFRKVEKIRKRISSVFYDMRSLYFVYSSRISSKKMDDTEERIGRYFSRAETIIKGYNLEYPLIPEFNGRRIKYPSTNFHCHWCGDYIVRKDQRFCGRGHSDNYYYEFTWEHKRNRIFSRDNYICQMCKEKNGSLQCDHITALCNGGDPWRDDNLQTLCIKCHKIKTKKDVRLCRKR